MPRSHLIVVLLALVGVVPASALGAEIVTTETLSAVAPVGGAADGAKININTATVKELMTLTGVGRKVAEKIVQYRDAHGPFKKPEEIRKVEGIGGGLWEQNKSRIDVK